MSSTPNFSNKQYVSSVVLDAAFQAVTASIAERQRGSNKIGLLNQSVATYNFSGLTLTATFPAPFEMIYGDFAARAHGATNGSDTQTYVVNATSLVPSSGTLSVYWYATPTTVQQGPFTVIGPPQGHPSYDPNFIPYVAYSNVVDSFSLNVGTTTPAGSLEIARGTLTHGSTTVTNFSTAFQVRAGAQLDIPSGTYASSLVTVDADGRPTFSAVPKALLIFGPGSSTQTVPAGVNYAKIRLWGGGGGGGGGGSAAGGTGGGGAGYVENIITVSSGQVLSFSVGAGGAGGGAAANGAAGNASVFGTLIAYGGGAGAGNGNSGGTPGSATGGLAFTGNFGGFSIGIAAGAIVGGVGGGSFCSGGRTGNLGGAGSPGNYPGMGGNGAGGNGYGGGNGADGLCIIEWVG
jgi:hypothetical protein